MKVPAQQSSCVVLSAIFFSTTISSQDSIKYLEDLDAGRFCIFITHSDHPGRCVGWWMNDEWCCYYWWMNEWCCYYLSYLLLTALLSDHIRSCTLKLTLRITRNGIDRWYTYSLSPSPYSGLRKLRVSPTLLAIARNSQWKFRLSSPLVSYSVQYFSVRPSHRRTRSSI